jgi:hypothetical protein
MSLVNVKWNPSRKDLNGFRLISIVATVLIGVLLYAVKNVDARWCVAIAAVGGFIALSGFVSLSLTRYIYIVLVAVTLPIGYVVSLVLMSVFYFGLVTPLGLVFRLTGRDALHRRFDPRAKSYWIPHEQVKKVDRYFQQF